MAIEALKLSNRFGFPCIEASGVNLTDTAETFVFNRHPFVGNRFFGGLFIKIENTPTAPATAVPINFVTQGVSNSTIPVYDAGGTALTTANWGGNGIYLGFYDSDDNQLRLVSFRV